MMGQAEARYYQTLAALQQGCIRSIRFKARFSALHTVSTSLSVR